MFISKGNLIYNVLNSIYLTLVVFIYELEIVGLILSKKKMFAYGNKLESKVIFHWVMAKHFDQMMHFNESKASHKAFLIQQMRFT